MAEVAEFLKVPLGRIIKAMAFNTGEGPKLVLIPGDREINLIKLKNAFGGVDPQLLTPEEAEALTKVPMGYLGPIGLPEGALEIVADLGVQRLGGGVVGAGEVDQHYQNAQVDRDFKVSQWLDLALATAEDPCPRCSQKLSTKRGIEVGHVFKLGTKYSEAMGATFTGADGQESPLVMGCYGIGVGRTVAAAIEQSHDHDGIIWPMPLAPYEVALLPLQVQKPHVLEAAEKLFGELMELGVETVLDDRDERPGMKFKDADLIGYPLRVTISEKSLKENQVELKYRATRQVEMLSISEAAVILRKLRDEGLTTGIKES